MTVSIAEDTPHHYSVLKMRYKGSKRGLTSAVSVLSVFNDIKEGDLSEASYNNRVEYRD